MKMIILQVLQIQYVSNNMKLNANTITLTVNQRVLGSSPREGASNNKPLQKCRGFFVFKVFLWVILKLLFVEIVMQKYSNTN